MILRLQHTVGNRAVARLIARQPKTDEQRAAQYGPGAAPTPKEGEEAGTEVESNEFGPLGKFMDEVVKESLEEAHIDLRLSGMFAKAWDIVEIIEFGRTGDVEHLGAPAATAAGKLADAAEFVEGVSGGSRVFLSIKVGGRVALVAWTTYEAFKLGAWIRGTIDAAGRAEDKARDEWRHAMMHHVWLDYMAALKESRAEKFDELAGSVSHDEVPALTKSASVHWVAMMNEASDDWKDALQAWQENAKYLAEHKDEGPEDQPGFGRTIHGADMAQRRDAIVKIVKHLAGHFARVREFALDPANWALTDRQKEILGATPMVRPDQSPAP